MKIFVGKRKEDPNYTVLIGSDLYEMDEKADQPNGTCIYLGNTEDDADLDLNEAVKHLPLVSLVPYGIVKQIVRKAKQTPC